jgi:hypothetical protein
VLRLVVAKGPPGSAAMQQILDILDRPAEWSTAHRIFSALRKETLMLEACRWRSNRQEALLRELYLAENVAKVLYNATNPLDEFDVDAGWWVAVCLKSLVDLWADEAFSQAAWSALSASHGGPGQR